LVVLSGDSLPDKFLSSFLGLLLFLSLLVVDVPIKTFFNLMVVEDISANFGDLRFLIFG